jgi:hypothetical protein
MGLGGIATAHDDEPSVDMARGHGPGGRPAACWHVDGYGPAGCLIASADDLLDYLALHLAASHPAVAEARRMRVTFPGGDGAGLGWMHSDYRGHHLVWHNGITGGFRSFVGFLPEENRAVVVLANGQGDVDALARRLIDRAEPPLPAHDSDRFGLGLTLILLAWGPILLVESIRRAPRAAHAEIAVSPSAGNAKTVDRVRQRKRRTVDRIDALRRPLTAAIALVLAERLGAWQDVPFAAWWFALAVSVAGSAVLAWRARKLVWWRAGAWDRTWRISMLALELSVLVLLFA